MNGEEQKEFEGRSRDVFNRGVGTLDAATRARLNQARQRALRELERPLTVLYPSLRHAVLATLTVAAFGSWLYMRGGAVSDAELPGPALVGDIDIMLAEDDLEFLEEIEFYAWLEAQPEFEGLSDVADGAG